MILSGILDYCGVSKLPTQSCYVIPEHLSGSEICPKISGRKDPAECGVFCSIPECCKWVLYIASTSESRNSTSKSALGEANQ
jgi:hypothetical protein